MKREEIVQRLKENKQEKKQLKKQLEELPKLEVGRYVRIISGGYGSYGCNNTIGEVVLKSHIKDNACHGNGLDADVIVRLINGQFWGLHNTFKIEYSHAGIVLDAYTEEADNRGFKIGVKHSITNGTETPINKGGRFGFNERGNKLLFDNWSICENGIWAEIIEHKVSISGDYTKEDLEKIIKTEF